MSFEKVWYICLVIVEKKGEQMYFKVLHVFLFLGVGVVFAHTPFSIEKFGKKMKDTIFREYDIRGKVGEELIIDEVYDLTRAIAYYFKQKNTNISSIAVGMDGRTHSPAIKNEMCRALIDSGINVIFVGMCPSPVLYFALHTISVDGGLMITASHNPKEYNGVKICLGTESIWGKDIKTIGALYKEKKYICADTKGTITDYPLIPSYIAWLADNFAHLKHMNLPVVMDCGNGAAGSVIPELIKTMGWNNIQTLYCDVDGTFPNHEADPVVEKNMQDVKQALATSNAVVGIGFDGDVDRMGAMTKSGQLVPGDKLMAVYAQPIVEKNPGATVVFNVVCSSGLVEILQKWGAQPIMTPVGHSIIQEKMNESGALFGGETSCHFFFKDRHFGFDDGIYAMMRLVEILVQSEKSLEELLKVFPKKVTSREYRISCSDENKFLVVEEIKKELEKRDDVDVLAIDGVRVTFDYGWGIVRPSNTQPVLSMRFESNTPEDLQKVKQEFMRLLVPRLDIDAKELSEQLEL